LLILGPSFRRRREPEALPALERYDGIFFRVARKHLAEANDVDVMVLNDDMRLIDGSTPMPYSPPRGDKWAGYSIPDNVLEEAREENMRVLDRKLASGEYSEVFVAMGKQFARALPDMSRYGVKVVFPARGGPGPKSRALKLWLTRRE